MFGEKLVVNFAGRKDSHLRVDILNTTDKVLMSSASLTGNHMNGTFEWIGGELTSLAGQQVKLKFSLTNGSFYSYWLE